MGCSQSQPADLPASISPLWKTSSSEKGSNGVGVPVKFAIGKHDRAFIKQTLSAKFGSHALSMETGGVLVLKTGDELIAICKKSGASYRIYSCEPIFLEQTAGIKHKGSPLYLYATVSGRREVFFVHKPKTAAFSILSGPKNSFEKYLGTASDDGSLSYFATWKYSKQLNRVEIKEPGHDVALIFCLVVISDLMDKDTQMSNLGKTVMQSAVVSARMS